MAHTPWKPWFRPTSQPHVLQIPALDTMYHSSGAHCASPQHQPSAVLSFFHTLTHPPSWPKLPPGLGQWSFLWAP